MATLRDPCALLRHAARAGDLALLMSLTRRLARGRAPGCRPGPATRVYVLLVGRLEAGGVDVDSAPDGG